MSATNLSLIMQFNVPNIILFLFYSITFKKKNVITFYNYFYNKVFIPLINKATMFYNILNNIIPYGFDTWTNKSFHFLRKLDFVAEFNILNKLI